MSLDPSSPYDTAWANQYMVLGDFGIGYAYGVREAAGTADSSPGYDNNVLEDGRQRGSSDFVAGNVLSPDDLRADPEAERSREQWEQSQQEWEQDVKEVQEENSDENQLVMWEDGSVMTKREHLAKEIRDHEGSPDMPEPVELGGD